MDGFRAQYIVIPGYEEKYNIKDIHEAAEILRNNDEVESIMVITEYVKANTLRAEVLKQYES